MAVAALAVLSSPGKDERPLAGSPSSPVQSFPSPCPSSFSEKQIAVPTTVSHSWVWVSCRMRADLFSSLSFQAPGGRNNCQGWSLLRWMSGAQEEDADTQRPFKVSSSSVPSVKPDV